MATQWPLVIFTLFVCITCGLMACMGIMALKDKGRNLQMTALIVSVVSLVIGGIGAFLHLEHWERIFNGFGHITSGITQELIGCVLLAIVMVIWFVVLHKNENKVPAWLAWLSIIVAVLMVFATGHSYLMDARPAWGIPLLIFYLCNACLLGPVTLWAIAVLRKDTKAPAAEDSDTAVETEGKGNDAEGLAINLTFFGAALQLIADVIYTVSIALVRLPNYAYYADPTTITQAPKAVTSLTETLMTGAAAPMYWCAIICAIIALVCAIFARKKKGDTKALLIVTAIAAIATSLFFRVAVYQVGVSVFMLY